MVDKLRRISEVKDGRGLKQLISNTVAPPSADRLIGIFYLIHKNYKMYKKYVNEINNVQLLH